MGGERLATATIAAAAVAWRAPEDYSVLAFGDDVLVVKGQTSPKSAEHVVEDLLTFRGFGTTDLALALAAAAEQLARSRAGRRVTVLLSDCRATVPGDVTEAARALDELVVAAPAGDIDDAEALCAEVGGRCEPLDGPLAVPDVFARLLSI